ncbi:hypothetical protein R3P38DRAFT_2922347 [Favolaschia claudopus]|uniref:HMG box domain-containing protein n=1 Tax=Favolaschia claudopus TaxID=2862362 RepID=A0AAW0C350_9AGAR
MKGIPCRIAAHPPQIKKPRNSFLCFRSEYNKGYNRRSPDIVNQVNVSCDAAKVWASMGELERQPYINMAQAERAELAEVHPEYRFSSTSKKKPKKSNRKIVHKAVYPDSDVSPVEETAGLLESEEVDPCSTTLRPAYWSPPEMARANHSTFIPVIRSRLFLNEIAGSRRLDYTADLARPGSST